MTRFSVPCRDRPPRLTPPVGGRSRQRAVLRPCLAVAYGEGGNAKQLLVMRELEALIISAGNSIVRASFVASKRSRHPRSLPERQRALSFRKSLFGGERGETPRKAVEMPVESRGTDLGTRSGLC